MRLTRRNLIKAGAAAGIAAGVASIPFINVSYSSAGRNIILVICDAFRFDRLGLTRELDGVRRSLTPNMDAVALEGITFPNAKSPSTFTAVSMLSLIYDAQPTGVLGHESSRTIHAHRQTPQRRRVRHAHGLRQRHPLDGQREKRL